MAKVRRRRIKAGIGIQNYTPTRGAKFPSEPGYVQSVQASMRAVSDALLEIFKDLEDGSGEIMIEALQPTFEKAKYYTPKDTGALVRSGYLELMMFRGKPRVEIGFGRAGHPHYAIYVHEMLSIPHEPPTRAKFLEYAVMEDLDDIFKRLGVLYKERIFA